MKFAYTRVEPDLVRPYLSITIKGPRARRSELMLLDSGADQTMISLRRFHSLGIDASGELHLSGLGGVSTAKVGMAEFEFAGGSWRGRVVGAPQMDGLPPLLGYRDFFRSFRVGFDAPNGCFYVESPSSV